MFVRARTIPDGQDFLDQFPALWNEIKSRFAGDITPETIESPQVYVRFSVNFNDVYRAVAKTAFNYLALRKGVAFARPEFDAIRSYIRGLDIRHAPPRSADEVSIDTRFVHALKRGEHFLVPTNEHLVMVGYSYPNVFATVTLYSSHTFVVHLGELEIESMMDFIPEGHEFSIDGTSDRVIDMFEIAARIQADRMRGSSEDAR
jgi:hypothetical protein